MWKRLYPGYALQSIIQFFLDSDLGNGTNPKSGLCGMDLKLDFSDEVDFLYCSVFVLVLRNLGDLCCGSELL